MKTLKRNISYNLACSILEANHYGVVETKNFGHVWTGFYDRSGRLVARYHEPSGRLQVITA